MDPTETEKAEPLELFSFDDADQVERDLKSRQPGFFESLLIDDLGDNKWLILVTAMSAFGILDAPIDETHIKRAKDSMNVRSCDEDVVYEAFGRPSPSALIASFTGDDHEAYDEVLHRLRFALRVARYANTH